MVYLLYEPGRTWGDGGTYTPGEPDYYMHQLSDLPGEFRLDEDLFHTELEARLPRCPGGVAEP
jgi:hypothetical protein